jgi:hypothetical protein
MGIVAQSANLASKMAAFADALQAKLNAQQEQEEREERKRRRRHQGPFQGMPPWAFGGHNPFSGVDYGDLDKDRPTDEDLLRGGLVRLD